MTDQPDPPQRPSTELPPAPPLAARPARTLGRRRHGFTVADWIQICILAAIAVQGYFLCRQTRLLSEQTALTERTTRFGILQQLAQETTNIENVVYDPQSSFQKAAVDNCETLGNFPNQAMLAVKRIIGHYEMYDNAARLPLISPTDWHGICEGAHAFIKSNCMLQRIWNQEFPRITSTEFQKSFANCNLSTGG